MTETYYPNRYLENIISRLGLEAYYKLLQKIDETQLILDIIIEKLEQYNNQLKELTKTTEKKE